MDNYFMKKLCQDAREGNNDMDVVSTNIPSHIELTSRHSYLKTKLMPFVN